MKDLSRNGYTHDEIVKMLHGQYGARTIAFKYLLLDKDENVKDELFEVIGGEVALTAFANIKRTARFQLRDEVITELSTNPTTLEDYLSYRLEEM